MNYGYGPATAWPSYGPFGAPAGWAGFPSPFWNPAWGFGTFPFVPPLPYPGLLRPNDEEIRYFVETAIDNDPEIPPHADIHVDVRDGVVTLTGTVPNKRIKHAAGDDAWWVPQVIDVHNEINVVPRRERMGEGAEATTATTTTAAGGRRSQAGGR